MKLTSADIAVATTPQLEPGRYARIRVVDTGPPVAAFHLNADALKQRVVCYV